MGMPQLKKPTADKKPAGKKTGGKKTAGKKTAGKKNGKRGKTATDADNAVVATNVDAGELIPLTFTVNVAYTNSTNDQATITASCEGPATDSTQVGPGSGTAFLTLVHTAPATGHTILIQMTDASGALIASDQVGPVAVVNPALTNPVTITPSTTQTTPPDELPVLDPNSQVNGYYDSTMGDTVTIEVEDPVTQTAAARKRPTAGRRKGHRKLNYSDRADTSGVGLNPHKKPWKHLTITGPSKPTAGQHLRAILTQGGTVQAIARARFV